MPRVSHAVACMVLLSLSVMPALAQNNPKPTSPGEIAAADSARMEKRAACDREARAQKMAFWKRRSFVKSCIKR